MKAYEIYQNLSDELVHEIFMFFRNEDRAFYSGAISSLAQNRKLRPQIIVKKPVAEQIKWAHKTLKLKSTEDVGLHLFQTWFMEAKVDLLVDFCDAVDIEHNGAGVVKGSLPETLDEEKVKASINTLLEKYSAPLVTFYLNAFNTQRVGGWESISNVLSTDERLVWS